MKPRIVIVAFAIVGVGLVGRAWLLSAPVEQTDDPVQPQLAADFDPLLANIELIRPLHQTKRPNQPGDWLEKSPEGGQSFRQFVQYHERKPLCDRFTGIDIQPLGELDETQQRILEQTSDFMARFYGVAVRSLESRPLDEIPATARRTRNDVEQVLTTWIMNEQLLPVRRPDAMATMGLVTCDLWSGDLTWVFGQASIIDRVGVCSLHRHGKPRESDSAYRLCLRRSIRTAVHETGHMLGMPHCAVYECCMNGCRSQEEGDRQPLEFCPECQPKIWWTCGTDPAERCRLLLEFCQNAGLQRDAEQFRTELEVLTTPPISR